MANLAGSGQALDSSLPTIYSEFRILRDATGVARKCATHYPLKPHTGAAKNILNYGRLQAYALQDGVDMAQAQNLADTNTAYTPSEVGLQVVLPKSTLRRVADPELLRRTGRMMNNAYDLKEDQDGCAQFVSFTPSVGTANTVLSVGHGLAAVTKLSIGNSRATPEPAPEPYYGVLHPIHHSHLAGRVVPLTDVPTGTNVYTGTAAGATVGAGRTAMGDEIIRKGPKALGTFFGAEVYRDANIAVDASDDASSCFFSKEGLIFVPEVEPMMEPDERDPSLRGIELNVWGSYAWGVYRGSAYGCELIGDATMPTS